MILICICPNILTVFFWSIQINMTQHICLKMTCHKNIAFYLISWPFLSYSNMVPTTHSYCREFGKNLPGQISENSPASQTGPSQPHLHEDQPLGNGLRLLYRVQDHFCSSTESRVMPPNVGQDLSTNRSSSKQLAFFCQINAK